MLSAPRKRLASRTLRETEPRCIVAKVSKVSCVRGEPRGRAEFMLRDNQTADAACSACASRARDFAPRVKRKKAGGVIFISNFAHLISSLFFSFVCTLPRRGVFLWKVTLLFPVSSLLALSLARDSLACVSTLSFNQMV